MPKRSRKNSARRKFNLVFGSLIFFLLIGTAFSFGWVFGVGFVVGFGLSIYNKTLEKKPLLPIFLFVAALVLRYALFNLVPLARDSEGIIDLAISLFFLVIFMIVWWRLRKGKWKVWKK